MKTKLIKKPDTILLFIISALLIFGLISLYSASTVESFQNSENTRRYITHQLIYGVGIGGLLMYIMSRIDYHKLKKFLPYILFLSLILLTLVKVPGIGFSFGGAERWIHIGPFFFQPSEFAKLAMILYIAALSDRISKKQGSNNSEIFPAIIILGMFSSLILWQPDFGTMSIIVLTSFVMFFISGVNLKFFLKIFVVCLALLIIMIKVEPYRWQRVVNFLDPAHDPQGTGYQISQALIAIGSGGMWGYGYGLSRQKHNYLPEPMGDSIFAITAEELGFVRICFILLIFFAFYLRSKTIANQAKDQFGKTLVLGISVWIILQAIINISAMLGLIPLTGVPLPFFSYGSSALIVILGSIGIILNVSRQNQT